MSPNKTFLLCLDRNCWGEVGHSIAVISPVMREGYLAMALATTTGGLREKERLMVSSRHSLT